MSLFNLKSEVLHGGKISVTFRQMLNSYHKKPPGFF
ncbi:hypothetical protein EVA_12787 [gut metagenome]|uniref:Uncharacterized protein n=1 Tax=gut metagenome TaxID=749906 RepID=J9GI00_9ZZZZ